MKPFWGRRILRALLPKRLALRARQEWLARQIAKGEGHLEGEIHLLPQLVGPEDICWDIGANAGMYTVALSKLASKVLAFEPEPHNCATLRQVIRLALLANVEVHQTALGDSKGRARFSVPVAQGFYGGFYMAAFHEQGELEVATDTIDSLIAQGFAEPDFIKCDVEGAELLVIQGATELLKRRRSIWLLEILDVGPSILILRAMESFGYAAHVRTPENTLLRVNEPSSERSARSIAWMAASRRRRFSESTCCCFRSVSRRLAVFDFRRGPMSRSARPRNLSTTICSSRAKSASR